MIFWKSESDLCLRMLEDDISMYLHECTMNGLDLIVGFMFLLMAALVITIFSRIVYELWKEKKND